jgi:dihydrofolate reductase
MAGLVRLSNLLVNTLKAFKAIAAMSLNRVIGAGGRIPWHLPEDFKWFKENTTRQIIVMGRKTFESIGKPLPNRHTVVLSRSEKPIEGVQVISSLNQLEQLFPPDDPRDIFICGGADLYAQTLSRCSDVYLTLVRRTADGDTYMPLFERYFEPPVELRETPDFKIFHYRRLQPVA